MAELFVGLLSGTSVDCIDAALVDFATQPPVLIASHNQPWPEDVRDAILHSRQLPDETLDSLGELDLACAECFAKAVNQCLQRADVDHKQVRAIGSHGQTIRHRPAAVQPFSLQIGNAKIIAEQTGIDVIHDFRTADIQAGGQGAPLVPGFHNAVFRSTEHNRVIVNIGGIANVTVLSKDLSAEITGFDTGPGNGLMDAWVQQTLKKSYDQNGQFAACGNTDARLLATLLRDDYFKRPPPKSTGFETFNLQWLQAHLQDYEPPENIQSTLCDLTATSIIRAIVQHAPDTEEIYVCGGGVHNTELMKRLQSFSKVPVSSTQTLGIPPDWVEAMTFAWLAKQYLDNQPGNIPSVTGAVRDVRLGSCFHAKKNI